MRHAAGGSNADVNEVITLCTAAQISQFKLTSLTSHEFINKSRTIQFLKYYFIHIFKI